MIGPGLDSDAGARAKRWGWRRKRILLPTVVTILLALAATIAWFSRERIAVSLIEDQLAVLGIPATYEIDSVGGQSQRLRNIVVGDPASPDLIVERAEVRLTYRFGTPRIGRITVVNARLYGRLIDGKVSFGSLDSAIYRGSDEPPGLPAIDIAIHDGRALIRTPLGPVGLKMEGKGLVSDGFAGTLAIAAPRLAADGCLMNGATAYGSLTTKSGSPLFEGPLRFAALSCPSSALTIADANADVVVTADDHLAAIQGRVSLATGPARYAMYRTSGVDLNARGAWRNGMLDLRHTMALRGLTSPQVLTALLTLEGTSRVDAGASKIDMRGAIEGKGLQLGPEWQRSLARFASVGENTLIAPLMQKFARALVLQARGSTFWGDLAVRQADGSTSILIPRGELRGGGGARIASLSRVEARLSAKAPNRIVGNIAMGGADLPELTGRMEQSSSGNLVFRLAMSDYRAGPASLAIPRMDVAQAGDGAISFAGRVLASGPLPGGSAQALSLPVSGRWQPGGALSIWRDCVDVGFDRLRFASLSLDRRTLRLCPPRGRAIVQSGRGGAIDVAAGAANLDLAGTLGGTPIRIASGPVGLAWPGVMTASALDIALGPAATASRFAITNLNAGLGGSDIGGQFDGGDVRLAAVPLDLRGASGHWRYANDTLTLGEGAFRLIDRNADGRFEPLTARGGTLALHDNVITAAAVLRHPASDRVVTQVDLRHDLATARGHADLAVPGIVFDNALQPVGLSQRALGIVANASGTVTGSGRIDWSADQVTSTGTFSSNGLDFAAAFGPVRGARGTVRFSDLIGLTTEPGQRISLAAVDPGIEVLDGEVAFQLRGGQLLAVEGGSWPFLGGRLTLKPVNLNFGIEEERRYEFEIVGLDAAAFVARFELPNVAVTGLFDGTVPIVFDAAGNGRVEGGLIVSRPPGGNVSYVGDLTYEDLSPIANFAFDALRSLDYQRMTVAMNGSLTGEIVTNVNIDQVRQGQGARRNFITRALANLPIQFRINISAPFYQLISSFQSLRDPTALRDPRELGLLSDDGTRFLKPEVRGKDVEPEVQAEDLVPGTPPVQN